MNIIFWFHFQSKYFLTSTFHGLYWTILYVHFCVAEHSFLLDGTCSFWIKIYLLEIEMIIILARFYYHICVHWQNCINSMFYIIFRNTSCHLPPTKSGQNANFLPPPIEGRQEATHFDRAQKLSPPPYQLVEGIMFIIIKWSRPQSTITIFNLRSTKLETCSMKIWATRSSSKHTSKGQKADTSEPEPGKNHISFLEL